MTRAFDGFLAGHGSRTGDIALAAALSAAAAVQIAATDGLEGPAAANLALAWVATGSLLWRRRHPVATAACVATVAVATTLALTPAPSIPAVAFAIIVASYSSGRHAAGRAAAAGIGLATGCIVVASLLDRPDDIVFPALVFGVAPGLAGRALRSHTLLARELAEKVELTAHLRDEEERGAVAAERIRVARELHDVLAHNLSVMVIHASGAQRMVGRDEAAVLESAALIGRTGRDALAELRRLFGPLRHGEGEDLDGFPDLSRLGRLVERARGAGLDARLEVLGPPRPLGPGAELAAYRVVQEALTNVLRHAGPVPVTVTVRHDPARVTVTVENGGPAPGARPSGAPGSGQGLIGMRERVELHGGRLEAGRRPGGGFRVIAELPVAREEIHA